MPTPVPAGVPPGGGNIQPFSSIFGLGPATVAVTTPARRATLAFLISFIAGLLILANAALLVNPFFAAIWVFLFPFVGTIGLSVAFAVGVIVGLIVLVGSFLYLVGFGITGSIIVFPAAIISFVIGGGFIAGLVLGIVAGLLGIFGR